MKKALAAAGIGAALTTAALLGASPASASAGSFLDSMHYNGFYNSVEGDYGMLNDGIRTCNMLNAGWSWTQTVNEIWVNEDMTYNNAARFVNLAGAHLC